MQHSSYYNEFLKVFTHDWYFNVYKQDYAWSRIWTCAVTPQWIWSPRPEPLGYHSFEIHVYTIYSTYMLNCIPQNLYSKIIILVFHRFLMKLGRWCHMLMICSGTWCYYSWITVYHTDTQGTGLLITWNSVRAGRLSSSYTCIYYQSLRVQINWNDHKWNLACATRCWLAKLKFPLLFPECKMNIYLELQFPW